MKRPLVKVALAYVGGLLAGNYLQPPLAVLFGVSLGFALLALGWAAGRTRLLLPLLFCCGWTRMLSQTAIVSPHDLRIGRNEAAEIVSVRAVLPATPDQRIRMRGERQVARSLVALDVRQIRRQGTGWESASGRVLVQTPGILPTDYFAGCEVEVRGVLAPPECSQAEGLFDYQSYLRRQGIYFELKAESTNDWVLLSATTPPLADRFTGWARRQLARGLPVEDEALELLWAMTLGWKTGLTNEIYEPFMRSGTMHIFAISGLHIALISGILVSILRAARIARTWCGGIVVPLLWIYTAVTGWQPSAIRSAIMMTIVIGGWSLKRPSDLVNSLAAAAFVILIWEPQQLFGASFQLSFCCVLSIALLLPVLKKGCEQLLKTDPLLPKELVPPWRQKIHGPLRWLFFSVATSLAAWLGSLPLTAYYFHLFSPVTLLANLLIVPLGSLALCANVGSLLCAWWPGVSELFNNSAWFCMECMIRFSQWAQTIPTAYVYVKSPSSLEIAVYYGALAGLFSGWLLAPGRRAWTAAAALILASSWVVHWESERHTPQMVILPMDGGVTVYVRNRALDGDLLVDPGTTNSVELAIAPYLRAQGVNRLPTLLLTHGDVRHTGGSTLLAAWFATPHVCASPLRFRSPAYRQALGCFSQTKGKLRMVSRGDRVGVWTVLHPGAQDRFPQADDNSIVLAGDLNGTRVLLVSDLGPRGQNALLESGLDLRADIIVTGLPTGNEPVTQPFLEAVQPRLILICDSEYPASNRASEPLRDRLEEAKIPVLYTRSAGTITIEFSRGGWSLRSVQGSRLEQKRRRIEAPISSAL